MNPPCLALLSLTLTLPTTGSAQDKVARGFDLQKLGAISADVQKLLDEGKIGGAVTLVARDGKIAHLEAAGIRDLASGEKMTEDTIFRIFSMTKPITTTAAMMLVEDGKLGLDDPVSKFLPELKGLRIHDKGGEHSPSKSEMTIADLMRHTSGLSYGFVGGGVAALYNEVDILSRDHTLGEMITKLSKFPLQEEPGTAWRYSISIDVLGRVVEVISGQELDVFFQERIFKPLGMVDTAFYVPEEKWPRLASQNRRTVLGNLRIGESAASSHYRLEPKLNSGGGGLCSTARDYFRFCQMIIGGGEFNGVRILKAETVRQMTSNQLPKGIEHIGIGDARKGVGFGYGFSVRTAESKWGFGGHTGEIGWGGAASTHFWMHPGEGLVVITMRNFMPYEWTLEAQLKATIYDALKD